MVKLLNIGPTIPLLNQNLNGVTYAGMTFKGEIKLFSLKRTAKQKALARILKENFDSKYKDKKKPSQEEYADFKRRVDVVLALTEVVDDEDWDFSSTIGDFEHITMITARDDSSETLEKIEKVLSEKFTDDLWEMLRTEVNIWNTEQCFAYRYTPEPEEDPFRYAGTVLATTLIFVNQHHDYKRVAVFWVRGRSMDFEDDVASDDAPHIKRVRIVQTPSPVFDSESISRGANTPSGEIVTPHSRDGDDGDGDDTSSSSSGEDGLVYDDGDDSGGDTSL